MQQDYTWFWVQSSLSSPKDVSCMLQAACAGEDLCLRRPRMPCQLVFPDDTMAIGSPPPSRGLLQPAAGLVLVESSTRPKVPCFFATCQCFCKDAENGQETEEERCGNERKVPSAQVTSNLRPRQQRFRTCSSAVGM